MASEITRERLADLLVDPREDLDLEIKNWLDLANDNNAKATLAKAALALANHGGGFIVLGLVETDSGFVEADGRPASFDGYGQDFINGVIRSYADPPFHCAVHIVAQPGGAMYPVIVVPGNHRVPIRARRSGPNGNIVVQNSIYIRKPGPMSEIPASAQEWDGLLARCLANRRDEMFNQIRDLVSGSVPLAERATEPARLDQWVEHCLARWKGLIDTLPADAEARCPNGYYFCAYELVGDLRNVSPASLPDLLRENVVRYTGWPPFWYPARADIAPYPIDGSVECWLGGDAGGGFGRRDAAHSDFWRISPNGLAFLLRGFDEDSLENTPPSSVFDITLPVWRIGEVLLHAGRLAANLVEGPKAVSFIAKYVGLEGRVLTSVSRTRLMFDDRKARQDEIRLSTTIDGNSIDPNLPEIIQPFLEPLYALFDFSELSMSLVTEELARMRAGKF